MKYARAQRTTAHKTSHFDPLTKHKQFHCPHDGCGLSFAQKGNMKRHFWTHSDMRPFHCPQPGCSQSFAQKSTLTGHIRTHSGQRPFECPQAGGGKAFTQKGTWTGHIRTNSGERPFHCPEAGCDKSFVHKRSLIDHTMTHSGQRPFKCPQAGCDMSFTQSTHLKRHAKTHTLEGQIRRKKQENRANKLLLEWGYTVDCETTINALSGKCLTDNQRHFSRLDCRLCIVEVDDDQHYWYNLSCEMSRMADVRVSLVVAGYVLPFYWVRYSPCGKYRVGSEQIKTQRPDREKILKDDLAKVCSPDFTPETKKLYTTHFMIWCRRKRAPRSCLIRTFRMP